MDFRILGSIEAREAGHVVALGGSKPRALLAMLLLHANETLSSDRLIDGLWGESPPATAAKAVQVHVSALRKALEDGLVVTREHGYELRVDPERIDARRFERLVAHGRVELAAGRTVRAAAALEEGVALWRGPPLADFAYAPFAQRETARLEDLRVSALEELVEAKLALGAHAEVLGRLEALIAENPHRERLRAQLMLALYRCERQADALRAYQDARETLVEELGIEPGEHLRELERAILAHDPALAPDGPGPAAIEPPRAPEAMPPHPAGSVVGREEELAAIDSTLARAHDGFRLLVIEGEPGIGKTTVWHEGVARAARQGYRVLSCRAAQAETKLSFAGLGDLLAPVEPDAFGQLPDPQRAALEVALLRAAAEGAAPDPRAIGTGLVSLLSALAAEVPVFVALDDVQWLDRPTARALEFALRRIESARVAVVATVRLGEDGGPAGFGTAVPEERVRRSRLGPLGADALYEILREQLGEALTRPLLGRIERTSRGNPFYALEIARALESAGPPAAAGPLPVPDDMRDLVRARLRTLPEATRDELLRASALAQPTTSFVDADELAAAVEAGVVSFDGDGRVEFAHPLLAAAIHASAPLERRREVHRQLAEVVTDLEERARHLSLGADGPDERVAAVLDDAADRAYRRGAPEAAAELAERAGQITPERDEDVRLERCLRAARHHHRAGDTARARALGEEILAASPACSIRAGTLHLLAEQELMEGPQTGIPLLEEALSYCGDDVTRAAQLELSLGLMCGAIADRAAADLHLDRSVQLAESAGETGVLAEAVALRAQYRLSFGKGLDDEALERALALENPDREVPFMMRPSLNVAQAYEFSGRPREARELLMPLRDRIVARGEESDLAFVLVHLAGNAWLAGDLDVAEAEDSEALRVATLVGQDMIRAFALMGRAMVRGIRGDAEGSGVDAAEAIAISERIGWPWGQHHARWAQAVLALSRDDPHAAASALEPVLPAVEALGVYEWPLANPLPDGIEALVATGDVDTAARLADALADWGRRFDRPWALALSGRCQALLHAAAGDVESAQRAAERALVDHERLPFPFERARTLLVLGQIQRRGGRRRAARESLGQALAIFEEIGARLWAEKAREEMHRIGVRRAPRELTENERRVAELAADGLTNKDIAAQLFLSRRTVEANLARGYRKLGIHSRAELGATMARRH